MQWSCAGHQCLGYELDRLVQRLAMIESYFGDVWYVVFVF